MQRKRKRNDIEGPLLMFYGIAALVVFACVFSKQPKPITAIEQPTRIAPTQKPKRLTPKEECENTGGSWVIEREKRSKVIWNGLTYVRMPQYRNVGRCEITTVK